MLLRRANKHAIETKVKGCAERALSSSARKSFFIGRAGIKRSLEYLQAWMRCCRSQPIVRESDGNTLTKLVSSKLGESAKFRFGRDTDSALSTWPSTY